MRPRHHRIEQNGDGNPHDRKKGDEPELIINAPPGKIYARAYRKNKLVYKVSFKNVPPFVLWKDQTVEVPELDTIPVDVAYGGAFYAFCRANNIDVKL
ncbi:MAG: proline racemase family protein [Bacteroidales bacterium]|nr:proline racemase family protein [Bacteroidales bacterium]MBS3775692.1 proline racemase family protein [Bacteroidales bacterium]